MNLSEHDLRLIEGALHGTVMHRGSTGWDLLLRVREELKLTYGAVLVPIPDAITELVPPTPKGDAWPVLKSAQDA